MDWQMREYFGWKFHPLFSLLLYLKYAAQSVEGLNDGSLDKDSRLWHPKYPPVIWYPEFAMFHNRTSAARIVVQMHDSLDFFCPDYLNSQYQSFTGAKKRPTDYGAEEIYMVNGEDYQQCFQDDAKERRLNKKQTKLLLRCPNKMTANDHHSSRPNNNIKAKYQYTVSFRMFSPMPKGPEFSCNHEYYFLGIFPGQAKGSQDESSHEEMVEKALCSSNALRLQIFVSCTDGSGRHDFDKFPLMPNVIQLDRPAPSADLLMATPDSSTTIPPPTVKKPILSTQILPFDLPLPSSAKRTSTTPPSNSPPTDSEGKVFVSRSDRKIMRQQSEVAQLASTTKEPIDQEGVTFIVEFDGQKITSTSTLPSSTVLPRSRRPRPTTKHGNYTSHNKSAFSRPRTTTSTAQRHCCHIFGLFCTIFAFLVVMPQLDRILDIL
ncbi:hypothetical protein RvY_00391 [Ramazzottius varieornatus]|uniref:Ephrin RBD domain-containing protein n=1 Tax=Ramazzottius varieornatus TaxID=947166 RepID=A0A1D1UDK3_RAMVA|nr:hypothetical protein RvY_00391 [Ramazzottius varieornatus]